MTTEERINQLETVVADLLLRIIEAEKRLDAHRSMIVDHDVTLNGAA